MLRDQTKRILNKYGINLSKKSGQSHLVDENILSRMVEYAGVNRSDSVLEIGPGIGNLTVFLVEKAGKVFVVEKDDRLLRVLRDRLGDSPILGMIEGDALKVEFPDFDKVVANLPYSISSPITFKLFSRGFDLAVLMYQKEFAERMVASPGSSDYSRLTVSVNYYSKAEVLEEVTPDSFIPQPEVGSAVVKLETRDPPFHVSDEKVFFDTVKAAFQHRRQKIRNSLYHSFHEIFPEKNLSSKEKREFIDGAISKELADLRPEDITPEEFGTISDSLYKLSKN